ncbi:alpha,alpha-phosphotrehalase [Neobacillus vireti]|uniref:Alpha,alpha-phosphotrehalase n=1 Tax=Neobacillus vireti LMG 21834 TaxID=1131730 RepID=A0AB94IH67_9BACI|nr:alpha,alpha-phosphotrehalase [Neobacillus vireti]ETI66460.1 alpha,alpha-phosphotrehalase [Neobacillus vireti LMG 21834]KLT15884.1 trehalose-6-phosphate hydrolase [Neobacillus vireti]
MQQEWWKKAVVYQIYPKSFNDTTGNGIGDLQGIIEKLDYLKELGVDVLWLTPIYQSPQCDNGYDISDYYSIHEEYGTMEDFDLLLDEAHKRGLKIIMDIVINHTSTEHEWFKQARSSKDNPYRDFYIWKDGTDGEPPTNWESKFGGSAWEYDEVTEQFYLHLFDVSQADLNWENEKVRQVLYEMMHFWLKKGVDGFRLDVINLISKHQQFPQDNSDGRKFYTDGPRIHEFLHEMNEQVFSKYDIMTVGEMSSTSIDNCIRYTNPDQEELNMTFSFHHLKVDYLNGDKWTKADFDFQSLKNILSEWQVEMNHGGGWNALFWCNHDQPRVVSRFGDDGKYHKESAKMLATALHLMQGTPYIYQGEEFGMTNPKFESIEDYRDVESLNMFNLKKQEGLDEAVIIEILKQKSRDNSRTPVQWNGSEHAGFTTGTPWIATAANYQDINAEKAVNDTDSIFYHYQKLIQLRKDYEVITDGDFELILENDSEIFAYVRTSGTEKLLVINHFYANEKVFILPAHLQLDDYDSKVLISNYEDSAPLGQGILMRPYESIVYHLKK